MGVVPSTILVVESEPELGHVVAEQLAFDGFRVDLARSPEHARILARSRVPDLAVLGSIDCARGALTLLEEIRSAGPDSPWDRNLPAIVIREGDLELDTLRAFEAGADDYMVSPARYLELRARIRAILRRAEIRGAAAGALEVGPLRIDPRTRAVDLDGEPIGLRRLEFELLLHLAREPDRVFSRAELLRAVWGYRSPGSTRTLDSHASRLRRRLGTRAGSWVIGVRGVGYRLV